MSIDMHLRARVFAAALIGAGLLAAACGGHASKPATTSAPAPRAAGTTTAPATPVADGDVAPVRDAGVQHQHYRYGPRGAFRVVPG